MDYYVFMHKKRDNIKIKNNEVLIDYLKSLKFPVYDKKHNLSIYLDDNRARSNQSRYEHIVRDDHELVIDDLKTLFKELDTTARFKKDKVRKDTYNCYVRRSKQSNQFIKMCIAIDRNDKHKGKVKTIFITRNIK